MNDVIMKDGIIKLHGKCTLSQISLDLHFRSRYFSLCHIMPSNVKKVSNYPSYCRGVNFLGRYVQNNFPEAHLRTGENINAFYSFWF